MNITLNQQKINETQSSLEIVILNKIKYLPIELKELLNNINFFKKSFNTHYDIKNNKLYVSCLKLKDEELKTAFASAIRFFKNLNIEVKIKNILEEQNKIRGFIKFLFYLKRILPLGIFTIAFDDFYKHDDTQELKYLKNSYVKNIRIMQLSIIFIILNLVLLLFSPLYII